MLEDYKNSQTWANDHLSTTTTILWSHLELLRHKWPLNNGHLSTTVTIFGSRGWSLYAGLTVLFQQIYSFGHFKSCHVQNSLESKARDGNFVLLFSFHWCRRAFPTIYSKWFDHQAFFWRHQVNCFVRWSLMKFFNFSLSE